MTGRLLILTLYYPPDLSACSFRAVALVEALKAQAPDLEVDVITSLPNRYHSFDAAASPLESAGGVTVRRLSIPDHRSDMITQASAYASFARRAAHAASIRPYDMVFATSSRLMTATLGAWVSRRLSRPLYLDIRDLFADTMGDILPRPVAPVLAGVFRAVERWTFRRASRINIVSPGFETYLRARYPGVPLSMFTNGIDDEFLLPVPERGERRERPVVVYAGNIGQGQGLHTIVPQLAARLAGRVRFRLIGDGGRRAQLAEALQRAGITDVEFVPPMPRERLITEYQAADILFLHLNDYPAFTRVLPSKIFEYAAMGKPIWAGVGGFAAQFIQSEIQNAAVFAPGDVDGAVKALDTLVMGPTARDAFTRKYARRAIMAGLAADVLQQLSRARHR